MENRSLKEEVSKQRIRNNHLDFAELSIKKPPVHTLNECLWLYTKNKLFDLAKEHKDHVSKYKKKAEMIELVEEILLKNIKKDSLYVSSLEKETIDKVIKGSSMDEINLEETKSFKDLGYIYWFCYNNEIQAICPEEISNKYMEAYSRYNEEDIGDNKDILNYAIALQHIYGVFEINQLIDIWNKYNKKKINKDLAHNVMNKAERNQDYFWWDSPYIVSNYFINREKYEEFLGTRGENKYYIPTEKEIEYYISKEFDLESIYYNRILNYFRKQNSLSIIQLNDLMEVIEICCKLNSPFQYIINKIKEIGYKFNDVKELNNLIVNYIYLSNNTRKWCLKGYKPIELSDEKFDDNVIQLQDYKISKSKKIGRNQPCPCDSGKKYKFCCGR